MWQNFISVEKISLGSLGYIEGRYVFYTSDTSNEHMTALAVQCKET